MKTNMKVWLVFSLMGCYMANAQNPDEEILKKLALQETEAFRYRDFDLWKTLYIQDEKTSITISGKDFYEDYVGWRAIDSASALVNKIPRSKAKILQRDIYIEIGERMAWMRFDQEVTLENNFKSPFNVV